ncbi:HET domain protein [Pyrenophora tritici-repentis]|nr:HET domain protein [Pyrenophora tritici-repentis]KAI0626884.1 HET domain protein [Pyrenophora tritici-repentis]
MAASAGAASPNSASYRYEPLNATAQQIRLLRLRSVSDSPIHSCEISIFDLNEVPPYVALSYTWDDESAPKGLVSLKGCAIETGQTICDFFDDVQASDIDALDLWLWIDQLCIDQANVLEKNHQIPLMSTIYSRCQYVIAWLGTDYKGISDLVNRRYFTRLWIVQEVLLAPRVRIMCETTIFEKSDLTGILYIRGSSPALKLREGIPAAAILVLVGINHGTEDRGLGHYMSFYSSQECKDPRDKVYGLLGLVQGGHVPTVDYSKSLTEVFVDAVKALHDEYWMQSTGCSDGIAEFLLPTRKSAPDYMTIGGCMQVDGNALDCVEEHLEDLKRFPHDHVWFQWLLEELIYYALYDQRV